MDQQRLLHRVCRTCFKYCSVYIFLDIFVKIYNKNYKIEVFSELARLKFIPTINVMQVHAELK